MNTTHTYMLIGEGWAYPGRSVEPSKRLLQHLAGKCKTTAPRIAEDACDPIMVPMEDYDFDLDDAPEPNGEQQLWLDLKNGEYLSHDYEFAGSAYPHWNKEDSAKGLVAMQTPEVTARAQANSIATNRKNGTAFFDPAVQAKGRAAMKTSEMQAKRVATCRTNKVGFFDQRVRKRGIEINRKNGTGVFDPAVRAKGSVKGTHVQWHLNRGIVKPDCSLCIAKEE